MFEVYDSSMKTAFFVTFFMLECRGVLIELVRVGKGKVKRSFNEAKFFFLYMKYSDHVIVTIK